MTDLSNMTREQLIEMVAKMKLDSQRKLTCKVSEKGAVAVYGLGKWPVTLYLSQWEQFVPFIKSGAVERFIEANRTSLSVKS